MRADFERRVVEHGGLFIRETSYLIIVRGDKAGADSRGKIKLKWRKGKKVPREMSRWSDGRKCSVF